MNYYIDFDNTLYDTHKLINCMLDNMANEIGKHTDEKKESILEKLNGMFNREHIYNIYKLAKYFANEYNIDENCLINSVESIILDGEKFVYDDVIEFLKKIRKEENRLCIFTFVSQEDLSYQLSKIKGSKLTEYFDNIIISSSHKHDLDINYENGIFIDDNYNVINEIAKRKPFKIIRIRRPNGKYSTEDIEVNERITEITSFNNLWSDFS